MRCLSVLDLVILFVCFFPFDFSVTYPLNLVLDLAIFLFVYFFPWPRSSKGPRMGRQFFKNVDFSVTYPLKGV